ncbi:Afadin and alpha-actinin-binding-domain-containing protein [Mrakia frigida]|uniref:Afadin and alpha-actinin-binding-domain-containing protein n=1 Tax=Mrakia frigida TaxID=29902 RepID=UPI003FCBFF12
MPAPSTPSASKFQQYSFSISNSPFGASAGSPNTTIESPISSLLYINSQLIAHGYTRKGINLSELRPKDQDNVLRCLFAMLQQRVDDLTRLETLSTTHRTLSYDYELLIKKHKAVAEEAAGAERKEQAAKSQLKDAQAALKLEQEAHKRSRDEASKARTALAFVRNQAQVDTKRREAETARTLERWQKLVNDQSKLITSRSGLTCVNSGTGSGSGFRAVESPGIANLALSDLEESRSRLIEENDAFRRILLRITNGLQSAIVSISKAKDDHPERITSASLFEPSITSPSSSSSATITSHATEAQKKIMALLERLARETWEVERKLKVGERDREEEMEDERIQLTEAKKQVDQLGAEVARLEELLDAQPEPAPVLPSFAPSSSTDDHDEITALLARQREALEEERRKFTEAAVVLGRERSEMEVQRIAFFEEKRAHQLDLMLNGLPPTPQPQPSSSSSAHTPQRPKPQHHQHLHHASSSSSNLLRSALKPPRSANAKGKAREVFSEPNHARVDEEDDDEEDGDATATRMERVASSPRRAGGGGGGGSPATARKVRFPLGSPRRRLGGGGGPETRR